MLKFLADFFDAVTYIGPNSEDPSPSPQPASLQGNSSVGTQSDVQVVTVEIPGNTAPSQEEIEATRNRIDALNFQKKKEARRRWVTSFAPRCVIMPFYHAAFYLCFLGYIQGDYWNARVAIPIIGFVAFDFLLGFGLIWQHRLQTGSWRFTNEEHHGWRLIVFHILPHVVIAMQVFVGGFAESFLLFLIPAALVIHFDRMWSNWLLFPEHQKRIGASDSGLAIGFSILVGILAIAVGPSMTPRLYQRTNNILNSRVPEDLLAPQITHRWQEENITSFAEDGNAQSKFILLYGPRGCGKTTLVANALRDRSAVVWAQVGTVNGAVTPSINTVLSHLTKVPSNEVGPELRKRFAEAARLRQASGENGLPVLVLEVTKDDARNTFTELAITTAREFSFDARTTSRVIVIVSDAAAAYKYTAQRERCTMMWLDDFSIAEAESFLDNEKVLENDPEQRQQLFRLVGTRPLHLRLFCDDWKRRNQSITEFASTLQATYEKDLENWVVGATTEYDVVARRIFNLALTNNETEIPFSALASSTPAISSDIVVSRIKKYGHLFAVVEDSRRVVPYSVPHMNLIKKHGIIPPPSPPGLRQDLPPNDITVEDFAKQTVGLDDKNTQALVNSEVTVSGIIAKARESKQALTDFVDKISNLSLGARDKIITFFFPPPIFP